MLVGSVLQQFKIKPRKELRKSIYMNDIFSACMKQYSGQTLVKQYLVQYWHLKSTAD